MATILAIEDHPDSLYMLQILLAGHGHEVLTAKNGAEGLSTAIEARPELIVSDILMPQMDGYQLCAAVRSNPHLDKTRFAFYTATYTDTRDEALAYELGADLFLRKPLDAELLIHEVDGLLKADRPARKHNNDLTQPEPSALKLYNESLVRKLEKKMIDLENEIKRREAAEAEKQSLERQLVHAQKMELLGQLAGGVAHDFNNLLQVICGNVELAQSARAQGEQIDAFLSEARTAGRRAADLVRQLLQFSRKQPTRAVDIDVNSVIESLIKMLRRLINENIVLEVYPAHTPCSLHGDAAQIEQMILNLCVNARDAMPNGGTLRVAVLLADTPPSDVALDSPGGPCIKISIGDTGTGIPDNVREHIFEPFFTTKPVGSGTGLGLAMVAAIARRHGGDVQFSSTLGKGTTFTVWLPAVATRTISKISKTQPSVPRVGPATILLAEDDEQVRQWTAIVLNRAGYTVIETKDGAEAVRTLSADPGCAQLAILDGVMPNMGGIEAFAVMRTICPTLPVLFVSGHGYEAPDPAMFPGARYEFTRKPYSTTELLDAVRLLLADAGGAA